MEPKRPSEAKASVTAEVIAALGELPREERDDAQRWYDAMVAEHSAGPRAGNTEDYLALADSAAFRAGTYSRARHKLDRHILSEEAWENFEAIARPNTAAAKEAAGDKWDAAREELVKWSHEEWADTAIALTANPHA